MFKRRKPKMNDVCWKAVHGKETLTYKDNLVIAISLIWTYMSAIAAVYAGVWFVISKAIDWLNRRPTDED